MSTDGLNLAHFEEAMHSQDEQKMRHALHNLINFLKIHPEIVQGSEVELGLSTTQFHVTVGPFPATQMVVDGWEGRPGVTVHERRVTPWVKRASKQIYTRDVPTFTIEGPDA